MKQKWYFNSVLLVVISPNCLLYGVQSGVGGRSGLKHLRGKMVELIVLFVMLGWALRLYTADVFGLSPKSYIGFSELAPEWIWATILLSAVLLHVGGFFINSFVLRQLGLLGYISIWLFIALVFMIGNFDGTGWIAYSGYFLLSILCLWRVGEQKYGR